MARPRKAQNRNLPPYTYFVNNCRWEYRPYLGKGKFGRPVRLAGKDATITEIWDAYHEKRPQADAAARPTFTLRRLISGYMSSERHQALAKGTKHNNEIYAASITGQELASGTLFGDLEAEAIDTPAIRRYMDKVATTRGKVTANRHYSFIQQSYKWAVEYGIGGLTENPAKGIKKFKEESRVEIYVEDRDYYPARRAATRTLKVIMELGYLCRLRPGETLKLRKADITEDGLRVDRFKGSKKQTIGWSRRLRTVVAMANEISREAAEKNKQPESEYLIVSRKNNRYAESGINTNWQRLIKRLVADGTVSMRYRLHDLKGKGVSDFDGDKRKASGHKSYTMTAVYDRRRETVNPSR